MVNKNWFEKCRLRSNVDPFENKLTKFFSNFYSFLKIDSFNLRNKPARKKLSLLKHLLFVIKHFAKTGPILV